MVTVAIAGAAASAGISVSITRTRAQAPVASATAPAPTLKTPWGDPDLQGIWTDETDTPLQRPAQYANQEFFTSAQRAELDKARVAMPGKDKRGERGTELDVTGSYNAVFISRKRTGGRPDRSWRFDRREPIQIADVTVHLKRPRGPLHVLNAEH
jgi:hypothetical protein